MRNDCRRITFSSDCSFHTDQLWTAVSNSHNEGKRGHSVCAHKAGVAYRVGNGVAARLPPCALRHILLESPAWTGNRETVTHHIAYAHYINDLKYISRSLLQNWHPWLLTWVASHDMHITLLDVMATPTSSFVPSEMPSSEINISLMHHIDIHLTRVN